MCRGIESSTTSSDDENSPLLLSNKKKDSNYGKKKSSFLSSSSLICTLLIWGIPVLAIVFVSYYGNNPTAASSEQQENSFISAFPDSLYNNNNKNGDDDNENIDLPCTPRKLHLSQASNVIDYNNPKNDNAKVQAVNFTLSFTVSSKKNDVCKDIRPYLIYGKKTEEDTIMKNTVVKDTTIEGVVAESEVVQFNYVSTPNNREHYSSDYIHHMVLPNLEAGKIQYWYRLVMIQPPSSVASPSSESNTKHETFTSTGTTKIVDQTVLEDYILSTLFLTTNKNGTSSSTLRGTTRNGKGSTTAMDVVGETPSYSFITTPHAGQPTSLALVGDLGQTENSTRTMHHIYEATTTLSSNSTDIGPPISALLIAGDMSYADGDPHRWESWFELMEPLLRQTPIQVAAGNHEIECDNSTSEIFVPYESYFRNPNRIKAPDMWPVSDDYRKTLWNQQCTTSSVFVGHYNYGNSFYSFKHGLAHIIVLNSYTDVLPGSVQYEWLDKELRHNVNRHLTPWLLVMFHCPLHTTFIGHNGELNPFLMLQSMEPLFVQYNINFIVSGKYDEKYIAFCLIVFDFHHLTATLLLPNQAMTMLI